MTFDPAPHASGSTHSPGLAVTTSIHPAPYLVAEASRLGAELNASVYPRDKRTLTRLYQETGAVRLFVVGPKRWSLHDRDSAMEYFYHPNMIRVRTENLDHGRRDLFIDAVDLKPGDRILDCTVGFAAEAILAARVVGAEGVVIGLESVPELAAITRRGVAQFELQGKALREAMNRVDVVTADYRDYLPRCGNGAFDVVYFDPFFPERLPGAENSVGPLAFFGNPAPLSIQSVFDARRVAKRRVVVKHPFWAQLPPELRDEVSEVVTSKKRHILYSVFTAF